MRKICFGLCAGNIWGCVALFLLAFSVCSAEFPPTLEFGFLHPPDSARPWVYSFWLNGNVTSNGITADLEAMKRVGIGGLLLMDVEQDTPPGTFSFASPEWRNLFKHLCAEAYRLGLQVNLNNDPGWCGSGGPWVTPELSMQKLVWTETQVQGGAHFDGQLPRPEAFQGFYRDITVLAFPTLDGDLVKMSDFAPKFTTSSGGSVPDAQALLAAGAKPKIELPLPSPGRPSYVQVEFSKPFTARQMVLDMGLSVDQICHGILLSSIDGQSFKVVREFDAEDSVLHLNFPEVTARYFRAQFSLRNPDLEGLAILNLEFSPRVRIEHVEGKAMFVRKHRYPGPNEFPGKASYPVLANSLVINRSRVLDLTDHLDREGRLSWDVPPGTWTVIRFGHTSNGTENRPAPQGGHGLECDKLSKAGVQAVFDGFVRKIVQDIKDVSPDVLVSTHVDSWEVGPQNWTENFREEFQQRRGYDPLLFLPVMTGRVVENLEVSERFLWDLRQTVSDLLVDNYAGHLHELARQNGLRLSIEAYDGDPAIDLDYARQADEPTGEFWILPPYEMDYSCTEMASAAHVYGKPIVGAEAFTATSAEKWLWHPFMVKGYGDWAFCEGINRFVIHRYAFQPWTDPERAPGMTMGPFGLHYERTETWWNQSKAWNEYLTRCQFLLQQGHFVADICFLGPETSPLHWQAPLQSRERIGYSFDLCTASAVLNRMNVKDRRIVLPDGMAYRVLVLPELETMTPALLAKLRELVQAGATIVGPKPVKSPSLMGFPQCDADVSRMAAELWGPCDGNRVKEHRVGKGRVVWGKTPEEVLAELGVPPDFDVSTTFARENLRYAHRTLPGTEIYFVANRNSKAVETTAMFRVGDKRPELWWPDTGRIEGMQTYNLKSGRVGLPLRLEPFGSVFVVFRAGEKPDSSRITSITRNESPLLDLRSSPQQTEPTDKRKNLSNHHAPNSLMELTRGSADGTNTFTMAVWAKPDVEIDLPPESNFGKSAYGAERNDALYPPAGHDVYHSPDHAGTGLSIGRNGVCVFEHTADYFAPVLVFPAMITNWTHVAVVYHQGKPRLYLDGTLVHEGQQSSFIVHSGVGVQHRRRSSPFQGRLGEFFNAQRDLNATEIVELLKEMPIPKPTPEPVISITRSPRGTVQAEVWQKGDYLANTARGRHWSINVQDLPEPSELEGPWDLSFPKDWGAPEKVTLKKLISWSEHADDGVKHFSGTATYSKSFTLPVGWLRSDHRVYLELGKVAVMAEVRINNKDLGILWKPPFRVDITEALKPGDNLLEIEVVNLWANRMIGDEALPEDSERNANGTLKKWPDWLQSHQPSPTGRYTFTTWRLWKKDSALRESGLLGPVKILLSKRITLEQENDKITIQGIQGVSQLGRTMIP
jgi:hypothetical protein